MNGMLYEAEVIDGLQDIARTELEALIGIQGRIVGHNREWEILFKYKGHAQEMLRLRTVIAVYSVQNFEVPRPKALLGHQNFQRLLAQIQQVRDLHPPGHFQTLALGAAGSTSSVMQRIQREIAQHTGLHIAEDEGDLLLRLRPDRKQKSWQSLVRLSPRPLSSRPWRVQNLEGALNASAAQAMVHLTRPAPDDTFLNIACGSGTILIERAANQDAKQLVGSDISVEHLELAAENIRASHSTGIRLLQCDARALPLEENSVDALCADLPFGQRMGSHQENVALYPAILQEAARVARSGARFVVLTHEVRLMERLVAQQPPWHVQRVQKIDLRGLHPRMFVLEKV